MSVFDSLAKEHALLLRLVERLERAVAVPDEREAARETRNILLVLLKALSAHEQLEHLVFDEPAEMPSAAARKALAAVEKQHEALADLKTRAEALLGDLTPAGGREIRILARRYATLLRRHFTEEERALWPSFHACAGRSTLHGLARKAGAQLRTMERDINRYWAEVESYLSGD